MDSIKEVGGAIVNPVGFIANATGTQNNDFMKFAQLAVDPTHMNKIEFASNLLNFEEGKKISSEFTGSKIRADKEKDRRTDAARKDQASDANLLNEARSAVDLMNPNSGQFTGQARTGAGQQELNRLLALFNQRQQDFAGSRARPGISQTRLV